MDGTAQGTTDKALGRLADLDVVVLYERPAESLRLFECRTGLSTAGHRHIRAVGYSGAAPGPGVGPGAAAEAAEKYERWRRLMRRDPEVGTHWRGARERERI